MAYFPSPPRSRAELFARLASIPDDVPTLTPTERAKLYDWFVRFYGPMKNWQRGGVYGSKGYKQSVGHELFLQFHLTARGWITGLLTPGKEVEPDPETYPQPRPVWHLDGDRLVERYATPQETIYSDLIALLHKRPFPFRRCRLESCGRILARDGKRVFCSRTCQERKRNTDPSRKKAMRAANKRARAKRRALREERSLELQRAAVAKIRAGGSLPKRS